MQIVTLIHKIIQEKFAYGELFIKVMTDDTYSCLNDGQNVNQV